ncbi:sensor domain-containing diguanylate cyclase [Thauera phenylacetica]|jgi:diguanylate cyclase (GGDEF)-like protein|uniref:diguanylate cyclase n=1 Tax=Thauera phenylacetica B4P TaxID=1234382 RepID=N6ZR88_9RHOO|nr:diguanylate cyclase [Thauera phenylacetica]ENO97022.1 diguanylate cyclase [Thauera phenylacetica B4P]MBP7639384.1 diguanylate cyclase [Thauera sp.]HRM68365.1 diguanylate cyclase [Thauera phenylacetica]
MIAALARYSLRRQMLLVLGLPSVVFVLCIAALFAHQSSRALDQALLERGRTMVRFLAPAAEYVLVSGNREALDALMARGLAQPDVVGVGFYDPGGEALAMLGEGLPPRLAAPVRTEGDEIRVDLADGAVGFEAAVVVVPAAVDDYAEDPPLKTAPVVGRVRVVLGTARLDAEKRSVFLTVSLLVLGVLAAAMVIALRLAGSVGEPVAALVRAVGRMADGDLAVRVPAHARNGELKALEAGFNAMAEAIAESQRTLQARVDEATVQLAWQAHHDPLTGLANRRAFEERIEQAVRAHRRSGDQITLFYIDLDHFKAVNDSCGHAAGDQLLSQLGVLLRGRLRAEDEVFRIGGDEFAAILRSCGSEDARRIAEGLCAAIADHAFECEGRRFRVGASIGLARMDPDLQEADALMIAADQACYAAKHGGRGHVVEYPLPAAAGSSLSAAPSAPPA